MANRGHVKLGTLGGTAKDYIVVDGSYTEELQQSFVPRFSTGSPSYGDMSYWQWFVQNSFRSGIGFEVFSGEDGLVHTANRVNLSHPLGAMLSRHFETIKVDVPIYKLDEYAVALSGSTTDSPFKHLFEPTPVSSAAMVHAQTFDGALKPRDEYSKFIANGKSLWDSIGSLSLGYHVLPYAGGLLVWNSRGECVWMYSDGHGGYSQTNINLAHSLVDFYYDNTLAKKFYESNVSGTERYESAEFMRYYAGHGIMLNGHVVVISGLNSVTSFKLGGKAPTVVDEWSTDLSKTYKFNQVRGLHFGTKIRDLKQWETSGFTRLAPYLGGLVMGCSFGNIFIADVKPGDLAASENSSQHDFNTIDVIYAGNLGGAYITDFAYFNDRLYCSGYRQEGNTSVIGWIEGDRLAGSFEIPGHFKIEKLAADNGRLFYCGSDPDGNGYLYALPHELIAMKRKP